MREALKRGEKIGCGGDERRICKRFAHVRRKRADIDSRKNKFALRMIQ